MGEIIIKYDNKKITYKKEDKEVKKIMLKINPLKRYQGAYSLKKIKESLKEIDDEYGE